MEKRSTAEARFWVEGRLVSEAEFWQEVASLACAEGRARIEPDAPRWTLTTKGRAALRREPGVGR